MDKRYKLDILNILGIVLISFILGMLAVWGITLVVDNHGQTAVCHAKTEDSVITDCDYQNGTWYRKW